MDWNYIIEKIESETGKSIAKEVGCRSQYISDLKSGKSKNPGADFVLKLIDHFKLNYEWLLTGKGELFISTVKQTVDISYRIPLLRQSVSCGTGQNWEDVDVVEEYLEPLETFPALKNANIYAFRARGLSMVGVGIQDGDIILFDGNTNNLMDDLYVFALDGNVYCKLLKFDTIQKQIQIYSVQKQDLTKAELIHVVDTDKKDSIDRLHIFGRVLAWIHENRVMWR